MSQLPLALSLAPVYDEDNFFVSACNAEAHRFVMHWPHWNSYALIVYGASGSGKSHLGAIWARRAQAALQPPSADRLEGNALLESIETMEQEALLHLLNTARENQRSLLLTSSVAPKQLPFTLPDLTSRLLALPAVAIAPPDDAVLAAAMRKQFADRQLKVEEDVVHYLVARIERSFASIGEIVEAIDRASLADHRSVTIPFVKRLLG